MKKILALILSLAMILSMSAFVFARDLDKEGDETDTVKVTVDAPETKYWVEVTWGSLLFTYKQGTWDVDAHEYTAGTWGNNGNTATITIENHSNAEIWFTCSKAEDADNHGFTITLDNMAKTNVASAETTYGEENGPTETVLLTVGVDAEALLDYAGEVTVGTVTITIAHSNNQQ